jgi:hypothetical protein
MINADVFVAILTNFRPVPEGFSHSFTEDLPDLPQSIVQCLDRGWAVTPVLSHSLAASIRGSRLGTPTSDRASLASLARQNPNCNWAVGTGNSLLILEVNMQIAMPGLRKLSVDDWKWRETLRFRSGDVSYFAFRHSGRRVRFLGGRYPGLKSHWIGSAVLLPPSWFVFGPPVSWASDFDAEVLDAPFWLLDPSEIHD